jgi:protein-S-isoprenylcysteine O-methyltransferase Ste14
MSFGGNVTAGPSGSGAAKDQGPGVKVPPMAAFGTGFVLAFGWLLVAAGTALFLWALRVFFLARTGIMLQKPATALMRQGPYRWSRNPQYVAFVAMYIGAALVTNTVWPLLLLAPVLAIVIRLVIAREERYLRRTFGASYDQYCRDVGRWV